MLPGLTDTTNKLPEPLQPLSLQREALTDISSGVVNYPLGKAIVSPIQIYYESCSQTALVIIRGSLQLEPPTGKLTKRTRLQ